MTLKIAREKKREIKNIKYSLRVYVRCEDIYFNNISDIRFNVFSYLDAHDN